MKKIISTIDDGLGKYFSSAKEMIPGSSSKLPNQMQELAIQEVSIQENEEKPFLIVTLVDENSPGHTAGIMIQDRILHFGTFNHSNFTNLAEIGELVKNSQNKEIKLKVRRNGTQNLDLIIVPKTWSGPGLLGFKINAIPRF